MNLCCISGKIVTPIKYDFIYNSRRHISLLEFKLKVYETSEYINSNTLLNIKAYDEKADYVYKFFSTNDEVSITGWLEQNMKINLLEIEYC